LVALSSAAYIAKLYIAFACLALAWVLMLLFGTRFRMKYTVVVYKKNRSEAKTFWQRKKDYVPQPQSNCLNSTPPSSAA